MEIMNRLLGFARARGAPLLGLTLLACAPGDRDGGGGALAATPPAAAAVVDSILPLDEALRRFRDGLPEVTALEGGAPTRDALVARFAAAVAAEDTAALRGLFLTRAEFAWLYYPESPWAREPTRQMAHVVWLLLREESEKGLSRVLQRFGGRPGAIGAATCRGEPLAQGASRVWTDCAVRVESPGGPGELRLFAAIWERDRRFKFASFQNDL
jgi:hypothetical protein